MNRPLLQALPYLLFCIVGCINTEYSAEAYKTWMLKNGSAVSSESSASGLSYSLTFLPADWLAVREAGTQDIAALRKARQEYDGLEYYRFRIGLEGGLGDVLQHQAGTVDEYYRRVEYFSFGLQQDLQLLAGLDTLPCKLFHFERNYGATPYMDFMLGFEVKPGIQTRRSLLYFDKVFSHRFFNLTIPAEAFQRIPKLKI